MSFAFDRHLHLNSPLHRWDPRHKVLGLMALIFAFAVVEDLALVPPMLAATTIFYGLSRLPVSLWRQRLHYPGFFIVGVVVVLPLVSGETVLAQWGPIALYWEGTEDALLIISRFISILTLSLILLSTGSVLQTLHALRSLGLPRILADMTLLSYRYLQELETMARTMGQAMVLRGYGQGDRGQSATVAHFHTEIAVPTGASAAPSPAGLPPRSPQPPTPAPHHDNHKQRHHHHPSPQQPQTQPPQTQPPQTRLQACRRWWQSITQMAALLGTLLLRSYEQSERVYQAMILRGYGASPRSTQGDLSSAIQRAIGSSGSLLTADALPPDPARLSLALALARAQPHPWPPALLDFGGLVATLALALAFILASWP